MMFDVCLIIIMQGASSWMRAAVRCSFTKLVGRLEEWAAGICCWEQRQDGQCSASSVALGRLSREAAIQRWMVCVYV